ncbi:MAG: hypothetical protein IJ633_00350 [Prevotella sp.]|nr:hypothetical protein [Prevotella sp.]
MKVKVFSILALLLMAATGTWAQTETLLTTITATAKEQASYSTANVATVSFSYTAGGSSAYLAIWGWWGYGWSATVNAAEGYTITKCVFYDDANRTATDSEAPFVVETTEEDKTPQVNGTTINYSSKGITKIEVYGYKNELALSETADNATTISEAAESGKTYAVTLTRTLQTGSYNTFAVPFDISAAELTAKGITAVKRLTASEFNSATGVLSLTFADATTIEAGKPYLIKVGAKVENPVFEGVTVSDETTSTETTAVDFIPTLGATTISGDNAKTVLFVGAANKLYNPTTLPAQMKGFRAYFQLKGEAASARSFNIDFGDGNTTGVINMKHEKLNIKTDDAWYSLDGRKQDGEPSRKGVYIVNGKKTVIK